jgi:hypothetical protein
MSSQHGNESDDDDDERDGDKSYATDAALNDPVMLAFATLFDHIKEGIDSNAE